MSLHIQLIPNLWAKADWLHKNICKAKCWCKFYIFKWGTFLPFKRKINHIYVNHSQSKQPLFLESQNCGMNILLEKKQELVKAFHNFGSTKNKNTKLATAVLVGEFFLSSGKVSQIFIKNIIILKHFLSLS